MTADPRLERALPGILTDLGAGPSPDYVHSLLARTAATRQRPGWVFPERWLPMSVVTSRVATASPIRWRTVVALALLIVALVAATVFVVGSRQAKVPPPFGLARNGLIAYSANGDIYTLDPLTGASGAIVTGPATDTEPAFSPDGRHVAFRRATETTAGAPEDIVVAGSDGSNPVVITTEPIPFGPKRFEWAPDSASILAVAQDDSAIWLFDATKAVAPRTVATNAGPYLRPFQPPIGKAILIERRSDAGSQLSLLDLGTGHESVLATGRPSDDLGSARWSPDGKQVVYNNAPAGDPDSQRLFIVNADGNGTRQITNAPGTWYDIDPTWSPDGRWIAFTRYERTDDATDTWDIRPTGIYSVADGTVVDAGPLPRAVRAQAPTSSDGYASLGEGFYLEWSPDGTSLIAFPGEAGGHPVLIDPADGTWRVLDQVIAPSRPIQAWQRTAS